MSIVCATHLSASSAAAVTVAAQLAQRTGERLILATALPGHGLGALALADGVDQERARLSAHGLEVDVALLHGKLERALERLCAEAHPRLLLAGDRPRDSFFSTPAGRLGARLSVPLLVVRGDEPFQAWGRGARALRVLLASESAGLAPVLLEWLAWLAGAGPLEVLAAVVHEDAGGAREGSELRSLRAALLGLPLQVGARTELEVATGGLREALPRLAAREPADLLLVGTRPTPGLLARRASLAHDLLRSTSRSVALVPLLEAAELPRAARTSPRSMKDLLRRSAEH